MDLGSGISDQGPSNFSGMLARQMEYVMTFAQLKQLSIVSTSILALTACGGGDSASSTAPPTTIAPPAPVTTIVSGPITGFGSVIVNGQRYGIDNASIRIEGRAGGQADLKVGQVVTMKATQDDDGEWEASEVSFNDLVQGPIESISLTNNRMVVLGQTVVVRASTSFDEDISPSSLEGLMVGDFVQVSGQINGGGNIVATQVELSDDTQVFEITGNVSGLNRGAMTFRIRGQDVDYSGAELLDFDGDISNGNRVEIEGSEVTSGVFMATSVQFQDKDDEIESGTLADIKGVITDFTSAQDFKIGEISIRSDDATIFENCMASDLEVDVEVHVKGTYDENEVVLAEEIECEIDANLEVESTVDAVDSEAGTLTVFGVDFMVNEDTAYQDKSETADQMFNLSNVGVGDFVTVKAYEDTDGTLIVKKLELEDAENEHSVTGPVDTVGTDSLVILGIDVLTDAETEFEDSDDMEIDGATFFGQVMMGDLVEAEGQRTETDQLAADEVEFETED